MDVTTRTGAEFVLCLPPTVRGSLGLFVLTLPGIDGDPGVYSAAYDDGEFDGKTFVDDNCRSGSYWGERLGTPWLAAASRISCVALRRRIDVAEHTPMP